MKDLILDVLVWAIVSCLPAKVQVLFRPIQRVLRMFLDWVLETIVIWAMRVRSDLEE